MIINARTANICLAVGQRQPVLFRDVLEDTDRLGHDLGTDVISGQDGKLKNGHNKEGKGANWRAAGGGGKPALPNIRRRRA